MTPFRIIVDDVDAAIAFYGLLGFELGQRWGPPFASVVRADATLWLSGPGTSARKAMPDGREPAPGGWNRFVIEVSDINATVEVLRANGVTFRNDPLSGPGGTQALVDDPSGNPVEIFQPAS